MSFSLYRKYRPQKFSEVYNQEHIKVTLENQLKSGRTAHAYLFCGPRGIGKTTLARIFAKALVCEKRKKNSSEPCLGCSSCISAGDGSYFDIIEMDAATHTQVEKVRANIIETAHSLPARGTYKIFIIDEVHMLSSSSFNALLKVIEEPPSHVVFVLATTEAFKVPQTIISRRQRFDFKKIPHALVVKRLEELVRSEKRAVDKQVLVLIANTSEGSLRDAESLLGKVLALDGATITLDAASIVLPVSDTTMVETLLRYMLEKKSREAIEHINTIAGEGVHLEQFTEDLIALLRNVLLQKMNVVPSDEGALADASLLPLATPEELQTLLELAIRARKEFYGAHIATLPLELMAVKACLRKSNRGND